MSAAGTALTGEQEELRAAVRGFLEQHAPIARARAMASAGETVDPAVWTRMAAELGLHGLAVPVEYGGSGVGLAELQVVLEEAGRVLLVAPFLATVGLAAQLLTTCEDPAARERWLPPIAAGDLTATVAVGESAGWSAQDVAVTATAGPTGWTISGTAGFVLDGDTADLLIIAAHAPDGLAFFGVQGVGPVRRRLATTDATRPLARVDLDAVPATRIAGDGGALLARTRDLGLAALAAEQTGGAQHCLETAVEYAKVREQFGRPIGSFQAIKHKLADVLIEVESAVSAVRIAGSVVPTGDIESTVAAALAAVHCSAAFTLAAKENIQVHGGIGYTWEHDAHLHLKRAKTTERLLGIPAAHRARLASLLTLTTEAS
ncbi:acyl-CoA dehydrogenase family protein [Pseudonocardia sp. NPDC049154]|uniref:acyl-CoA dehydrogenase family protein n=1 Tax=Pseudonocardia sp. NPDC049154 TaxID=3155501 RepID=UPI0033C357F2